MCVNHWYFSCVLITISLGGNQLSICGLLIKKSFIMSRKMWRMSTFQCCMWWQDQNFDELESQHWSNLVIIYKLQSVWAYYLRYHLPSTACTFTLFFAVRLSRLVLTLCNPRAIRSRHMLSVWFGQDSACYCWVFVKRNFVCESKFSWWLFNWLWCLVFAQRLCLLNTSLFKSGQRDSVWEKSSFNLVDSKLVSAFDGVVFGFEHLR
jgi:hypothetical protein